MSDEYRIEYVALSEIQKWPRNPKLHDEPGLDASIERFGFTEPIVMDESSGKLVAGHGRLEALCRRRVLGKLPPARIGTRGDDWLVPVVRGISFASEADAEAYLLASNKLVESGGWDNELLAAVLHDLKETPGSFEGTGWDTQSVADALAYDTDKNSDPYTRKVESPVYNPTGSCPDVSALVDTTKVTELVAEINAANIPDDIKEFLRRAASRHAIFDYANIAEFYSHADAPTQQLMERSVLVIIDFNKAIELGHVKLVAEVREEFLDEYYPAGPRQ